MNKALYTEMVMHHARNTKHHHELEDPTHVERGHNPSCGDDLTLMLHLEDGMVKDASYIGDGCAISKAAMSMAIDLVIGKTVEEAQSLANKYLAMISNNGDLDPKLGDLNMFETLKTMPARVKCGTLGMHCIKVLTQTR